MARIGIAVLGASAGRKGGVDVYAVGLADALAAYGRRHQYTVLSTDDSLRSDYEHVGCHGLSSKIDTLFWYLGQRRGCSTLSECQMTQAIDRACRKHCIDCLHFPATRIPVPNVGIRSVLTFFDMQYLFLPQFFAPHEPDAIDKSYRQSVNKAEYIISPTQFTSVSLREKYHVPTERIVSIPAGISDTLKPATLDEIAAARSRYCLPADYMIYPANPWPHKNHERLLLCVRMLRDSGLRIPHLVLTGRLPGKSAILDDAIRSMNLGECVSDLGFVPKRDVEVLMSGAKLMVFPSLFEGFGYPILEAMSCGCPVASSNAACLPEIVKDAGVLFDPLSIDDMARSVSELIGDEGKRSEIARKGYARADAFRWSRIVPLLEELYARFE